MFQEEIQFFLVLHYRMLKFLNANAIFTGVNAVDYSGYPDCRPEFIAAFQNLTNLATKRTVEGGSIEVHAPLD